MATTTMATLAYSHLRSHIQSCLGCRRLLRLALDAHYAGKGFELRLCDEAEQLADELLSLS